MKKFLVTQKFDATSDQVATAFNEQTTWQGFAGLPFVGDPTLVSFTPGAITEISMSYRVMIHLPALAEAFIDEDKMTFVENTRLQANGSGTFDIVPDHYENLLKASGRIEMVPFDDGRCERLIQGSVDLSLGWTGKLFEGPVEDAIVTGFKDALVAQAKQVAFPRI